MHVRIWYSFNTEDFRTQLRQPGYHQQVAIASYN